MAICRPKIYRDIAVFALQKKNAHRPLVDVMPGSEKCFSMSFGEYEEEVNCLNDK